MFLNIFLNSVAAGGAAAGGSQSPMAISLISQIGTGLGSDGGTTGAIDTTGANYLFAFVGFYAAAGNTPAFSDSKGNTWISVSSYQNSEIGIKLFYCKNPSVGAGHTFTVTAPGYYLVAQIYAFAGLLNQDFDVINGSASGGTTTAIQAGSITPSQSNELVFAAAGQGYAGAEAAIDGGFTSILVPFGNGEGLVTAYKIKPDAAAENPAWTFSTAINAAALIVAFKGAPAVADSTPPAAVTNLTADANRNLDSGAGSDNVAVTGYITQRRVNGGAWINLSNTQKAFQDNENLPTSPGTYTLEYRRAAVDGAGNKSLDYSNIASVSFIAEVVLPSALTANFEEFQLSKIFNIQQVDLDLPLLSAKFGGGYISAGVLSAPECGLRAWTNTTDMMPDMNSYQVNGITRFKYFWDFFRRHTALGIKPFYFYDPGTEKYFLASFSEPRLSLTRLTGKIYAGSITIEQRRVKISGLTFNADDGSIVTI